VDNLSSFKEVEEARVYQSHRRSLCTLFSFVS
jgi:hypothetical protein